MPRSRASRSSARSCAGRPRPPRPSARRSSRVPLARSLRPSAEAPRRRCAAGGRDGCAGAGDRRDERRPRRGTPSAVPPAPSRCAGSSGARRRRRRPSPPRRRRRSGRATAREGRRARSRGASSGPTRRAARTAAAPRRRPDPEPGDRFGRLLERRDRRGAEGRELAAGDGDEAVLVQDQAVALLLRRIDVRAGRDDRAHARPGRDDVRLAEPEARKLRACAARRKIVDLGARDPGLLVEIVAVVDVRGADERRAFPGDGEDRSTVVGVEEGDRLRERQTPARRTGDGCLAAAELRLAADLTAQAVAPGAGRVEDAARLDRRTRRRPPRRERIAPSTPVAPTGQGSRPPGD